MSRRSAEPGGGDAEPDLATIQERFVAREPDPGKVFATLQARLAMAGWALLQDGPGGFLACRWGRAVALGDLQGVEAFAQRVGVQS